MVLGLVRIHSVAKVATSSGAYSLYVRQRPDARSQVFSLDYGDRLRVYDTRGSLRASRKWSSKVRCIAVADVEGEGEDALIGGVGKKVLVVTCRGKPMWNINLESPILACDSRDVDGDSAAEVVVGLQNRRVILWNDDKMALFSRTMDSPLCDVWLEDITNDSQLEVVIAERNGTITILTSAGYQLKRLQLGETVTVFGVLAFGERRLFVTGNHSTRLRVWDLDGREVARIELSATPKAIATGIPDDVSDIAYLVVSTGDRRLGFWEVEQTTEVSKTERITLQQIESTKTILYRRAIKCGNCGANTSPEDATCDSCGATLEILDEYAVEEFLQESLESITSKHTRIPLKELDRILRRTLAQPAAYNLRRSLQTMIKKKIIRGHFDENVFVRTGRTKLKLPKKAKPITPNKLRISVAKVLGGQKTVDIEMLELETGVDRQILRRTLLILLGEGLVEGELIGDSFILDKNQDIREFVVGLNKELKHWTV